MLSELSKFLMKRNLKVNKEVKITTEVDGEKKELVFKVKSIGRDELNHYQKQSIKINTKTMETEVDNLLLGNLIIENHCIDPNFKDSEFLKEIGGGAPIRVSEAINKCLTAGEVDALTTAIMQISGINNANFKIIEKEAKKS